MFLTRRARLGLVAAVATAGMLVTVPAVALAQNVPATANRTAARTYDPWTPAGKIAPGIKVSGSVRGHCWTGSIAENSSHAFRCMSGNGIWDPCFAPPGATSQAREVACAPTPWSKVEIIRLTKKLPKNTGGRANVWAFQLGNGARCVIGTGTNAFVHGVLMDFYCTHGLASSPRTDHEPWTAKFAGSYKAKRLSTRDIRTAWF